MVSLKEGVFNLTNISIPLTTVPPISFFPGCLASHPCNMQRESPGTGLLTCSPSHSTPTQGKTVPAQIQLCAAPGRVATRVLIYNPLVWPSLDIHPQPNTLTTRPPMPLFPSNPLPCKQVIKRNILFSVHAFVVGTNMSVNRSTTHNQEQ